MTTLPLFILTIFTLVGMEMAIKSYDDPMDFIKAFQENSVREERESEESKKFTEVFSKDTENRPTKCQVCRVLAQELVVELNRTDEIKKEYFATSRIDGKEVRVNEREQKKKIDYSKSEIRLLDITEKVCNNVYNYRVHAGPPFPYLKGVKSLLKQALDDLGAGAGLPVNVHGADDHVNDPTSEMRRMFYKCTNMIEEYEDDITDWYMNHQGADPVDFLCADRVLKPRDRSCLHASTEIPKGFAKPKKEKNADEKKKVRHFEL